MVWTRPGLLVGAALPRHVGRDYYPWERLRELDADRRSAMAAGANHAVAALRTTRDHLPAMQSALAHVVAWCQATAPRRGIWARRWHGSRMPSRLGHTRIGAGGGGRPVSIGGAQPSFDCPPHRRAPRPARQADSPPGTGSALPAGLAKPRGAPHQGGAANGGTPANSRVGGADLGRLARPDTTGSSLRGLAARLLANGRTALAGEATTGVGIHVDVAVAPESREGHACLPNSSSSTHRALSRGRRQKPPPTTSGLVSAEDPAPSHG